MGSVGVQRDAIWHPFSEGFSNGGLDDSHSSASSLSPSSPPALKCIEHRVTKMDTLAGIAIKYGVEIPDIKRMNNLVSDLQMFAHKSLQIPLPGRYTLSPVKAKGSARIMNREQTPIYQLNNDSVDSASSLKFTPPQQRTSAALSTLQSYYSLTPQKGDPTKEGTEMAVYATGISPASEDRFTAAYGNGSEGKKAKGDMSVRRCQKADADILLGTTQLSEVVGGVLGKIGKGLYPRPKTGNCLDADTNTDPLTANGLPEVQKSLSTSSLAESEGSSSTWPTSKWTLNPEAITQPFLNGLPKHVSVWRNKNALD